MATVAEIIGHDEFAHCEPVAYTVDDLLDWLMPTCGLLYVSRAPSGIDVQVIFANREVDSIEKFYGATLLDALELVVQAVSGAERSEQESREDKE